MIAQQVLVWCVLGGTCWAQAPVSYSSWGRGPLSPLGRRLAARFPHMFPENPAPMPAWLQGLYMRPRVEGRSDDLQPGYQNPVPIKPDGISQVDSYQRQKTQETSIVHNRLDARPVVAEKSTPSILQYSSDMDMDGGYSYKYETSDGVVREEQSVMGDGGVATVRGSYSYPSPDGRTVRVSYIADHSGFRTIPTNKH